MKGFLIWVLAPHIITEDETLAYYYDFDQSIEEYRKVFNRLNLPWKWQPVTSANYQNIISQIPTQSGYQTPMVLNLCDGDGTNDVPGVEVIQLLEELNLCYTGADEYFYNITTSKITMKECFDAQQVSTSPWKIINDADPDIFTSLTPPVIIKPAVSAGSLGLGVSSVVRNKHSLAAQVELLEKGYRGWQVTQGGIFAEQFISGPEFTSLIVGDSADPGNCYIYPPVERVFHKDLPDYEKFLSFDRLWEIYEIEPSISTGEDFYTYHSPEQSLLEAIDELSLKAYKSVKGVSYGRIDLRMDQVTKKLYVLEVNAQCGLSDDENYTSIGAILRLSNQTFSSLIGRILNDAARRKYLPDVDSEFI